MNKFERVSGLGHQMSLARGPGLGLGDPCTGRVWAVTGARAWAPCIVMFKALWVMVPWEPPPTHAQLKTLPSRNFIGGW